MAGLAEALIASGWLGRDDGASNSFVTLPLGADVLPVLVEAARQRMETQAHLKTSKTKASSDPRPLWVDVLDEAMRRGAKLTLGWPECEGRPLESWLGPRLMWWPSGIPEGRKVAWVSSRLGRAIDERPDWFAVLRSATAKLDPTCDVLLTAPSTTVDRFLERAAILFGLLVNSMGGSPEEQFTRVASGALFGLAGGAALGAAGEVGSTAIRAAEAKLGGLAPMLEKKSGELAWSAAGPTQKMTQAADGYAGGADAIGKIIRDEAP